MLDGNSLFEHDLGRVVDAVSLGVEASTLTTSLIGFYMVGDLAFRAVLVGEVSMYFVGDSSPRGFDPFEDVERAVGAEGHADGIDDVGSVGDDLQLEPLGQRNSP